MARSRIAPRPGPSGSGSRTQPTPSSGVASASAGSSLASSPSLCSGQASAATLRGTCRPARCAAARRSACSAAGSRSSSTARFSVPAPALVLELCLRLGVALDRVGGELVDVGEDRLGEQAERLRVQPGLPAGPREAPPGHSGTHPVGGLQRVERAALPQLAPSQAYVYVASDAATGFRIADQGDELAQRLPYPRPDPAAEASLQRPGVLRHLASDRREDLRRGRVQLGLDQVGELGRQRPPGLGIERNCHLPNKIVPRELTSRLVHVADLSVT